MVNIDQFCPTDQSSIQRNCLSVEFIEKLTLRKRHSIHVFNSYLYFTSMEWENCKGCRCFPSYRAAV